MPGDSCTVQAVAAVLAASQKYMRDQSVSCKISFPKSCFASYCFTEWVQGAMRSVFSDIQQQEWRLTSRGVWITHEIYFSVLYISFSLLHSRSLRRQATGGALRDDKKNCSVADYITCEVKYHSG